MKRLILFLLPVIIFGCAEKRDTPMMPPIFPPIYYSNDSAMTAVMLADTMPKKRYFLISYNYTAKEDVEGTGYGYLLTASDSFPSKKDIDKYIFAQMPHKKAFYQPIIITSFFEFKSKWDYLNFDK